MSGIYLAVTLPEQFSLFRYFYDSCGFDFYATVKDPMAFYLLLIFKMIN